jgi:hypothetical protein
VRSMPSPYAQTHPPKNQLSVQCREVCATLRQLQPHAVVFTQVEVAGGRTRAAAPGTLAAAWRAAAAGPGARRGGVRTRELIQASLMTASRKAMAELRAAGGDGVLVVCGSLHAVGAALRQLPLHQFRDVEPDTH